MDTSKLKRKSQDEYSKERKICCECKESYTEFNDLTDDVIEMILHRLELEDLTNISDTNTRIRKIAASVFSRKYKDNLISINADSRAISFAWRSMLMDPAIIVCKTKPIIGIFDADIWFKLLRNFGKSIKYIRVSSESEVHLKSRGIEEEVSWKNLSKYILEYCCIDSLEILEFGWYNFFFSDNPFTNLQEFFGNSDVPDEALKLMPNIRTLSLINVPKTLKTYFPHLEKVALRLETTEAELFCSFLHLNRQIKNLKLQLRGHNELIYSSIIENLPDLKVLKIHAYYHNATRPISTYRFNSIDKFEYCGFSETLEIEAESYEFNDLEKLTLKPAFRNNIDWTNYVVRNRKLKVLKMLPNCNINYPILSSKLPELNEIIINYIYRSTYTDKVMLTKILTRLGKGWEITKNEVTVPKHKSLARVTKCKCIFQRIRNTENITVDFNDKEGYFALRHVEAIPNMLELEPTEVPRPQISVCNSNSFLKARCGPGIVPHQFEIDALQA